MLSWPRGRVCFDLVGEGKGRVVVVYVMELRFEEAGVFRGLKRRGSMAWF